MGSNRKVFFTQKLVDAAKKTWWNQIQSLLVGDIWTDNLKRQCTDGYSPNVGKWD